MMKSIYRIMTAMLAIAGIASSCAKESVEMATKTTTTRFTARVSSDLKVSLDGVHAAFEAGDLIKVFSSSGAEGTGTAQTPAADGTVEFIVDWTPTTPGASDTFYAVSGGAASDFSTGSARVTLTDPVVAAGKFYGPMVAVTDNESSILGFKHASSVLKVTIPSELADKVTAIAIEAASTCNSGKVDCATGVVDAATLTLGDLTFKPESSCFEAGVYYLPVLPQTITGGIKITYSTSEGKFIREKAGDYSFERARIYDLGTLGAGWAKETVWHDFTAGNILIKTNDVADDSCAGLAARQTEWTSKGILHADNAESAYIQFVSDAGNASLGSYYAFSFSNSTNIRQCFYLKGMFTKDALIYHVPVLSLNAGDKLLLEMNTYVTGTAPLQYYIDFSVDGGLSWTAAETGTPVSTSHNLGNPTNFALSGKSVNCPVAAYCEMPAAIEKKEILIRFACADGTYTANNASATAPNTTAGGNRFGAVESGKGIVISRIEAPLPPTPGEYYDFSEGAAYFKTIDAKTSPASFEARFPEWVSNGKIYATNASCITAQFIQNPANTGYTNQPVRGFNAGATSAFQIAGLWTGDALEFNVPAVSIAKDAYLVLNCNVNTTGTASQYYLVEYSEDGGTSWTKASTGQSVVTSRKNGAEANFTFSAKGSVALTARCKMAAAVANKAVKIRIVCVDGTACTDSTKDLSEPGTAFSFKIGGADSSKEGILISVE